MTTSNEDLEKTAQAELFVKLASEHGIDLNQLNDEQITELYTETFKTASEEGGEEDPKKDEPPKKAEKPDDDDDEEGKKEAAAAEFAAQQEWNMEQEKADFLGRKMAHAMVDELTQLGQGGASEGGEKKEAAMPAHLAAALGKVKGVAGKGADKAKELGSKGLAAAKNNKGIAGAAAGGAAAGGAAGYMAGKKQASAIDQLAAEQAVKIAHESGYNAEEAADRIIALDTLGSLDREDSKVASASNVEQAVGIRALEMLETAGYPVTWE